MSNDEVKCHFSVTNINTLMISLCYTTQQQVVELWFMEQEDLTNSSLLTDNVDNKMKLAKKVQLSLSDFKLNIETWSHLITHLDNHLILYNNSSDQKHWVILYRHKQK